MVWSQTAVCGLAPWCISVASCFIGYFCCPLFSPPSPAIGSLCVLVLALPWQSVGVGTTVYSRHFPGTINNKAPSAGRVERVFVIVGSTKDPPCFHRLMSVAPCTCRSNIHGREAAVTVKELSPEPVPTPSALLFLSLWNLVLRPPWETAALLSMPSV